MKFNFNKVEIFFHYKKQERRQIMSKNWIYENDSNNEVIYVLGETGKHPLCLTTQFKLEEYAYING